MHDWLGLVGRKVLVVGAGGLGGACAAGFAEAGAHVAIADVDADRLRALAIDLDLIRRGGATVCRDLSMAEECRATVREAATLLEGLDVVVHALGVNVRVPVLEATDEQWERVLGINLSSAFWVGQAAGRMMCIRGGGRMVFISSVSGLLAHQNHAPYAASKGGMNQLLRVMAAEWAGAGVGVNAVAPGYIETSLTQQHLAAEGVRAKLESMVPAGRLGTPEEVVGPTMFLASPRSGFVTGHVLYVDGGRTLV